MKHALQENMIIYEQPPIPARSRFGLKSTIRGINTHTHTLDVLHIDVLSFFLLLFPAAYAHCISYVFPVFIGLLWTVMK